MTDFIDAQTGEVLPNTEDNIIVAFALYQQEATNQKHWRSHRFLTDPIRKAIKARLAEGGGIESWREALGIASRSDFLSGNITQTGKPRFRMDLNFFTRPASYEKILSGFYTREPEPPPRIHIPTGYQPPHRKPAQPFVPEHPDIRDSAAIISWRKIGRFDKANEVETRMAARQNRPPVHVPAPEVAREGVAPESRRTARNPAPATDIEWTEFPE